MDSAALPTVLVLASGRGERFKASGGQVHKLQALLGGTPVMQHTLAAVRASGLPWHVEDAGHPGMGDSIAAGVRATAGSAGWLVLPADLPLVQPASLRAIAAALRAHAVVAPVVDGQRGHPVGFAASLGPALMALSGPQGAASIVRAHPPHLLPLSDIGCTTDIDTLADLQAAEAAWRARISGEDMDGG